MHCKCQTSEDTREVVSDLARMISVYASVNSICHEQVHRALAVLAADPAVTPFLAEAAVWAQALEAEAKASRH